MDAEAPLYDVDLLPPQEVRDHVSGIPDSITATGNLQDKMRTFQNAWKDGRQWLQYDNASHVCWCEPCAWALAMNRFPKFIRIEDVRSSSSLREDSSAGLKARSSKENHRGAKQAWHPYEFPSGVPRTPGTP